MKRVFIALFAVIAASGFALAQKGITVWTYFSDTDLTWLQHQAASFQQGFGVPVNIVHMQLGDIKQKMLLSASKGGAADLMLPIPHDQIGEMAAAGVLADMTDYATPSYLATLNPQARLAFTYDGKLFGLPLYIQGPALIINTNLVKVLPKTFQDFLDTAQKLTTKDTLGFIYDDANFYFSYVWMHSLGGYVFKRNAQGALEPDQIGLANEGAVKGAQLIKDMRYKYNLIPAGATTQTAEDAFTEGRAAMIYDGPWEIPNIKRAGIPFRVIPLPPQGSTKWSGFMNAQGILINQYSKDKVDVANFAKWLTRPEAQVALAKESGRIPASQGAAQQVTDEPVISGFSAALANNEPTPSIPAMGSVWQAMGDALETILESPDSDVQQALQKAVTQVEGENKPQ